MITLLGPAATRKWWEAVKRGDVGVLERQVSLVHDKHARSLLAQNYSHYGSSTINDNFPSSLTLQQAVSNLINMQQPWEKVLKDEDPYLDEFDGGSSALILACGFGHTSIVSFLLSLGCVDLALTDANGMHALHHACVQGNADIVKILLLSCPSRSMQLMLIGVRDKRAMDCRKLVAVGQSDWQSAGVSAHSSGSFLRRKAYQKLLLPTVQWWKSRKDRRKRRRRLGAGPGGDNAGSRDFDRAQDLLSCPPAPISQGSSSGSGTTSSSSSSSSSSSRRLEGVIGKDSMDKILLLASRRTRSALSSLSNEHIWLTAMEYDETEELELGSAVAHSPALKKGMETVTTVSSAKLTLVVLRFLLNMRKGKLGVGVGDAAANGEREEQNGLHVLLKERGGANDASGVRISWHNVDEQARQKQENEWMSLEDASSNKVRSYLTVETLKMLQLESLYCKLSGEKASSIPMMSGLKFARFASVVGSFANEEHVATILTSLPSILRDQEYVGDCSFINFVQFWLHAETLERRRDGSGDHSSNGSSGHIGEEVDDMVDMLQRSNETEGDAEKIDWFQRLRARMRITRSLATPQNGDPSECIQRSKVLARVHMGVGVLPTFHPTMVSHRKERSALVRFQPAKEFTQEEVIRQRRARNSKSVGNQDGGSGSSSGSGSGGDGAAAAAASSSSSSPPSLPEHLQRHVKTKKQEFEEAVKANKAKEMEEEEEDDDEETKEKKRKKKQLRIKNLAAAKRMEAAKGAAVKAEARANEIKKRLEEKKQREEEEAKIQAATFELEQKKERKRLKKIERNKKKEEQAKKKAEKSKERQAKRETGKKKRKARKTRAKDKKTTKNGRRKVDNGTGKDARDNIMVETPEERNKQLEETERSGAKARKKGHRSAVENFEKLEKTKNRWGLLKSVTKVASVVTDVMWNVRSRTALELATQKEVRKDQRKEARKKAMRLALSVDGDGEILGEDIDLEEIGQLKAPQDEDSILARKKLLQKQFDPHVLLGVNHEAEGWHVSYDFTHSGYAHKMNLNLVKLRPLQFFN